MKLDFKYGTWAILPEYKAAMEDGNTPTFDNYNQTQKDIQVISVCGVLLKNCGLDDDECDDYGVCDIDDIVEQLEEAAENPNVGTIVLAFDTPGGEVTGVYELGKLIEEIGNQKTVIGYTSDLCASAGYWLFAKCNEGYCSPSSRLGHIGVTCERLDLTQQLATNGIKVDHISSSPRKTWGDPTTAMSEEERVWRNNVVMQEADTFKTEVLSNRAIDSQYLDAVLVNGVEALSLNFADGNYNSLEDLLETIEVTQYEQF